MSLIRKGGPFLHLTPDQQKGLFLFALLMVCFLGVRYGLIPSDSGPQPKPSLNPQRLVIELGGEVIRPGLYFYTKSATAAQILKDGGGSRFRRTLGRTDENRILSKDTSLMFLHHEGRIIFQERPLSPKALWILGRPIPLNRAGAEDLDRLPGIGPMLARRIIQFRDTRGGFTALEELKEVKGLKEKTFEKVKNYLSL